MKRAILISVALAGLLFGGCGGAGEKGKNKDKDMPAAPEVKKG